MAGEIAWASEAGGLAYLVLTAARARTFARTGRLVSKVEAAEAELDGSADEPVVRAALAQQLGDAASIDATAARRYAAEVARDLRAGTPGR